jgi:hypothetical protein
MSSESDKDVIIALVDDQRRNEPVLIGEYEERKKQYSANRVWAGRAINSLMEILNMRRSKNKEIKARAVAVIHLLCKEAMDLSIAEEAMNAVKWFPEVDGCSTARTAAALGLPPLKSQAEVNPMLDLDANEVRKYVQKYRGQVVRRMMGRWDGAVKPYLRKLKEKAPNLMVDEPAIDKRAKPK